MFRKIYEIRTLFCMCLFNRGIHLKSENRSLGQIILKVGFVPVVIESNIILAVGVYVPE